MPKALTPFQWEGMLSADEIARRCRGTPRIANRLLRRLLVHVDQGRRAVGQSFVANPDFDSLNARWHAETKDRPLDRVLEDFHGVRRQTLRWVDEFSDEDLTRIRREAWLHNQSVARWIAEYSYEHEAEHTQAIRAWRQTAGV